MGGASTGSAMSAIEAHDRALVNAALADPVVRAARLAKTRGVAPSRFSNSKRECMYRRNLHPSAPRLTGEGRFAMHRRRTAYVEHSPQPGAVVRAEGDADGRGAQRAPDTSPRNRPRRSSGRLETLQPEIRTQAARQPSAPKLGGGPTLEASVFGLFSDRASCPRSSDR
jgi:hypothetical protein